MPAHPHRPVLALLAVAALAGCTAGCTVGFPPEQPPTGVDGLTVPTPSPDPAAYVAGVDHPHLPLAPGAAWRLATPDGARTATVEVEEGTREVAGVATTAVRLAWEAEDPAAAGAWVAWVAEDRAGHVWLLAGEGPGGAFEAGEGGAEAGLLLAADPRTGDGHALWARGGEPAAAVRVESTGGSRAVPGVPGSVADDLVVLALDTDTARPGAEAELTLAAGTGPVALEEAGEDALVLVGRG